MATRKSNTPKILLSDAIEENKTMPRKKQQITQQGKDTLDQRIADNRDPGKRAELEANRRAMTSSAQQHRMELSQKHTEHSMPSPLSREEVVAPHAHAAAVAEDAARSAPKPREIGAADAAIRKGASSLYSAARGNPIVAGAVGAAGLAAGAVALNRRKKRKQQQDAMYGYNNQYQGGDVWSNPDGACASLEAKCFNDPKRFGSSSPPGRDDILAVPGLVGRLAATVRS